MNPDAPTDTPVPQPLTREAADGLRGALEALADGFADAWAQRRADADREPPGTTQQHVDVAAGRAWWVAERNLRAVLAAHPADAPAGPEPDPFLAEIRAAVDAADRDAPQRCGHSSEPMCCPFENFPTLAAWFRQATADAPAEAPTRERMEALIEKSSLGTPEAKAIRDSVPQEAVDRIMARVRELEESEPAAVTIPATGNGMKSHDNSDAFLEVSGGPGNTSDPEVHLLIRSNDGDFAQSWFRLTDVRQAVLLMEPALTPGASADAETAEAGVAELEAEAPEPSGDVVEQATQVLYDVHGAEPRIKARALADAGLLADPEVLRVTIDGTARAQKQLTAERDRARATAVALEQENARVNAVVEQWRDEWAQASSGVLRRALKWREVRAEAEWQRKRADKAELAWGDACERARRASEQVARLEQENARLTEERDERQHSADWAWRCANGYGERAETEARARRAEDALRRMTATARCVLGDNRIESDADIGDYIDPNLGELWLDVKHADRALADQTSDATPSDTTTQED